MVCRKNRYHEVVQPWKSGCHQNTTKGRTWPYKTPKLWGFVNELSAIRCGGLDPVQWRSMGDGAEGEPPMSVGWAGIECGALRHLPLQIMGDRLKLCKTGHGQAFDLCNCSLSPNLELFILWPSNSPFR